MKSRTSFFNPTVFAKNLTRFAPAWGLYTIGLLMCLVLLGEGGVAHSLYRGLGQSITLMALANLGYALICALLLFGDLYNSRMCNALHAMPLRRECWFGTHLVSALVFNLIPTAVMTLGALIPSGWSEMVDAWQIPLYWFLGSNLQFIFFFGLTLVCVFCAGNRFAMATIYGILNFASVIGFWMVDTLYTPLVYGVATELEPFQLFSPFVRMVDSEYITTSRILDETITGPYGMEYIYHGEFAVTGDWKYLWVCAGVGAILILAALQMYRKRKLESAGDFVAIGIVAPVFQVVYTLIVGCMFQFVVDDMFGLTRMPVFLVVGLAVGWFTGRMLLERNVRVFRVKNFLGFATLTGVLALTLAVTMLDPLGIETWLPETDAVESVTIYTNHGSYHWDELVLEEEVDIETVRKLHEEGFTQRIDETSWMYGSDAEAYDAVPVTIQYKMKNGTVRSRYYYYWTHEESGKTLASYFSRVEAVFGVENPTVELLRNRETGWGYYHEAMRVALEGADVDLEGLMAAMIADCEAGTMAQHYTFGRGYTDLFNLSLMVEKVDKASGEIITEWKDIEIDANDAHCVAWLEAQGVDVQSIIALGNG